MDSDDELEVSSGQIVSKPTDFFNKIVHLEADLIYNAVGFVMAPITTLLSLTSESYLRTEEAKSSVERAVRKSPSAVRRASYGVVAAGTMWMVMVALLVGAVSLSSLGIRLWMEEAVGLREKLNFDYSEARPRAFFS